MIESASSSITLTIKPSTRNPTPIFTPYPYRHPHHQPHLPVALTLPVTLPLTLPPNHPLTFPLAQVIKAAEPAFAAAVGFLFYGQKVSIAKLCCLVPIIGGIVLASVTELDFTYKALIAASSANVAAAFRGQETKRVMADPSLKTAVGGPGNAYALTTLWATLILIPTLFISGEASQKDVFKVGRTEKQA